MTSKYNLFHTEGKYTRYFAIITFLVLILMGYSDLQAQVAEDSTRIEREGPEQPEEIKHNTFINTPYQTGISESYISRYQINDFDSDYNFFRRLRNQSIKDFILSKEEGFNPYGPEWEQMINENLMAILDATFKEKSDFFHLLSRIAPFLGFSFYEPYEVPVVPRMEDPDLTPRQPSGVD